MGATTDCRDPSAVTEPRGYQWAESSIRRRPPLPPPRRARPPQELRDVRYYVPNQVHRDTTFTYKAGKPIFELNDPYGDVYVMQSYAQIIDKTRL